MPQEFQVLRCYACQTFQVHQVKKVKKWNCKICGEKQSLIKVYGQGTGAECRRHTQKLNMVQGELSESLDWRTEDGSEKGADMAGEGHGQFHQLLEGGPLTERPVASGSRWSVYLEDKAEDEDSRTEDNTYTTDWSEYRAAKKQGHRSQRYEQKSSRRHQGMENPSEQRWTDKNPALKSNWGKRKQPEEDSSATGYSCSKRKAEEFGVRSGIPSYRPGSSSLVEDCFKVISKSPSDKEVLKPVIEQKENKEISQQDWDTNKGNNNHQSTTGRNSQPGMGKRRFQKPTMTEKTMMTGSSKWGKFLASTVDSSDSEDEAERVSSDTFSNREIHQLNSVERVIQLGRPSFTPCLNESPPFETLNDYHVKSDVAVESSGSRNNSVEAHSWTTGINAENSKILMGEHKASPGTKFRDIDIHPNPTDSSPGSVPLLKNASSIFLLNDSDDDCSINFDL